MSNATLRQLRAVIAIQRLGTIVGAAKAMGLTGPAVTLQLKQLEEDAGVALFDRTAHGMRPTIAGLAFIEAAEAIVERLRLLEEELEDIRGAKKGSVSVGVVSTAQYFAPQLAAAFMAEFPAIEVRLMTDKRPQTIARLKNHDVDFLLTARPPREVSVRAVAFAEYLLGVVVSPGNPLAAKTGMTKADLMSEPFIVREPGSGPRASFERFLGSSLEKQGASWIEMVSNEAIRQAVMADLGIAFVALHSVATEVADGRLAVLDVEGLPIRSQWFAVTRTDRSMTPAMAAFQDFLIGRGGQSLHAHDAPYGQEYDQPAERRGA